MYLDVREKNDNDYLNDMYLN